MFTLSNISLAIGILLMLSGIWAALTQKNIIKMIIGFVLFDTGIHIVMVSVGYIRNRTAPILNNSNLAENAAEKVVDPIPQALVLTAIVIGLGVTALMLVYALRMYREKKSLNINSFKDLKW